MSEESIIVGDVETTGLDSEARIIEIAWVEINSRLEITREVQSLIDPEIPIPSYISGITNITDEDVEHAPTIEEFFTHCCEGCLIKPTILVAHNAIFDLRFFRRHTELITDSVCTMRLARRLFPEVDNHKLPTLKYHFKLTKHEGHRALNDVLNTLELLKIFLDKTGLSLPELIAESKKSIEVTHMPFGKHKGAPLKAVPPSYISWLLKTDNLDPDLKDSILKLRA